ncbi:MAG: zinc transporter binding subunit ZevA [Pasteurellaceae bacterium]|nr:zinc transporter binding subunit ZevA [Pasteurellaceae bacterium]
MKKIMLFLTAVLALFSANSQAHPHAFIDMKTKVIVKDNQLSGFAVEWLLDEISSSEVLYDLKLAKNDSKAVQTLADEMIKNVVSEHYFSYLYDAKGNRVKYSAKPHHYGLKAQGQQILYYFEFNLTDLHPLTNTQYQLEIYDPTYYVSMFYPNASAVDFSQLPAQCKGEMVDPQVDEKTKKYAQSLDKTQRDEDYSLGAQFAQKVRIMCQ